MRIEVPFNYAKTTEFGQIRFLDCFEKKTKPVFFSFFFLKITRKSSRASLELEQHV